MSGFLDQNTGFLPPPPVAASAVTIGGAISGGTAGRVLFETAGPLLADSAGFTYADASGITLLTDDATTAASLTQLTLSHTSSGTAAAGFGVGILFKAESAGGTLRSIGSMDSVLSTATDAAEVSAIAFKTMLAGTLTEVFRIGTGAALPDSDVSFSLGRALIDSRTTDRLVISHRDMTSTTQYALTQTATGSTTLNCASGQSAVIAHNNTTRISVNTTGIGFFGAAAVAQQALSGSRGANAALATVCTALANLGLCTDGTTA